MIPDEIQHARRFPALPFALAVMLGVLAALYSDLRSGVLLFASAGLFILALVSLRWNRYPTLAILLVLTFFALLGYYRAQSHLARPVRRQLAALATVDSVTVSGRIAGFTDRRGTRRGITVASATMTGANQIYHAGILQVKVLVDSAESAGARIGDHISACGRVRLLHDQGMVGAGAVISMLTRREAAVLQADSGSLIIGSRTGFVVARGIEALRASILGTLDAILSPDAAALSKALLLGDRSGFGAEFSDRIRLTGLSHLFALSGMNVGLLLAALWLLLTVLGIPRVVRLWLLLGAALLYMEMGREAPSLVRASLMAVLFIAGHLLYRRANIANILAAAAFVELLWHPLDLIDAGFLLSYLAVLGLVSVFPLLRSGLLRLFRQPRNRFAISAVDLLAAALAAQIATLPLVGYTFHRIPLLGILGNLLAVPAFALSLILTVLLLLLAPWLPGLSAPVAHFLGGFAWLSGEGVRLLADLPLAGIRLPSLHPLILIVAYGLVLLFFDSFWRERIRWIGLVSLAILNLVIWSLVFQPRTPAAEMTFIAVENGDAILLSGNGTHVLIDAGPAYKEWSAAERIERCLSERGIERLSALILTHPDMDHIGGAFELLCHIPVDHIYTNGGKSESLSFERVQLAATGQGKSLQSLTAGQIVQISPDLRLTVLSPSHPVTDDSRTSNMNSLVLRLDAASASALLCADIDSVMEANLLAWNDLIDVDLLKVSHHGSRTATSEHFLDSCTPVIAVLSYGRRNIYGHPHPSVVERLRSRGIVIHETAKEGTISFASSKSGWVWHEPLPLQMLRRWRLMNG